MKTTLKTTVVFLLLICLFSFRPPGLKKFPAIDVKTLDGQTINSKEIHQNNGKLTIIGIWATWCKPCFLELKTYHEHYPNWREETGVKIALVSVDEPRLKEKIKALVQKKGWEFEMYIDDKKELKQALKIINIPGTYLVNDAGDILYQHSSYSKGDENKLYKQIKKLSK
ncbi:MAG: TlpA family protein disulfide reductase [Cytophagales bacterium]|nr:TlpA family protein disulfide reductase [Cytophagales bacterium]